MGLPNNINAYRDVDRVLRAALRAGGGKYKLPTRGKAVHWRLRAYQYRKLLRQKSVLEDVATPYDNMLLAIPPKGEPEDNVITISFEIEEGELYSPDGNAIPFAEPPAKQEEDLMLEVEKLLGDDND